MSDRLRRLSNIAECIRRLLRRSEDVSRRCIVGQTLAAEKTSPTFNAACFVRFGLFGVRTLSRVTDARYTVPEIGFYQCGFLRDFCEVIHCTMVGAAIVRGTPSAW